MGGFYGSIQVRTADRDRIKAIAETVAQSKRIKCLVGPALDGWVGVYPEGSGQDESVGQAIASQLPDPVLHLLVHDDDIFAYWYWRAGKLIDSFDSCPGYFGEEDDQEHEQMRGNPEAFRDLVGAAGVSRLQKLLTRGIHSRSFAFEYERLEKFAKLLRIPNALTAYEYLKDGERDHIEGWKQFEELPAAAIASEKATARSARKRIDLELKRLKAAGLLLLHDSRKDWYPRICRAGDDGFILAQHDPRRPPSPIKLHRPPWQTPADAALHTQGYVIGLAADQLGSRIAAAMGELVVVWQLHQCSRLLEIPERDRAINVTLSPDGALLAHASRIEIVITDVASGSRILSVSEQGAPQLAFHPSAEWLITTGPTLRIIGVADKSRSHSFCVGGRKEPPPQVLEEISRVLGSIDQETLERQTQARMEAAMKQLEALAKTSKGKSRITEEQLATMRSEMQKQLKLMTTQLFAGGNDVMTPRSREALGRAGVTRDGRWLWCGTNAGLRVYPWDSVLATKGDVLPPPRWHHDLPPEHLNPRLPYVYDVVEDPRGGGLFFAGDRAHVHRIDLVDGSVRPLLTLPEETDIIGLDVSSDGAAISVLARSFDQRDVRKTSPILWQVWSLEKLRAAHATS